MNVTYGTACESFLAVRAMQELANIYALTYSLDSSINDFYVDDILSAADTEQEVRKLQSEVIKILSSGGFYLRKWASNCLKLLQDISHTDICEPIHLINGRGIYARLCIGTRGLTISNIISTFLITLR